MLPNIKVAVHPGEILKDFIDELGLSQQEFADLIGKKQAEVSYIINGARSVNADWAIRVSIVSKTSPEFWLKMQYAYDVMLLQMSNKKDEYEKIAQKFNILNIS